ncbi:fatty-acid peroxygenase [Actinoplanes octamycinicus]|uniref:Fatty-acid peroxygenase n=1 Tax=Actinoplanes octamycinicus TaxID=135948 RepID=A0A7W7H3F1_9ACTN|nr:cytochrome P450 [Actinoplanes octamycinicus]MBB4743172.1 fatty-acid peroxygenase [Actinoplanes octamycinicus]GIE61266.1 cytochrome P450 [Actinoplanes octamycinicus]
MSVHRHPIVDDSLGLAAQGYSWFPGRWRRSPDPDVLHTRLMGRHAVGLRGPDAVRFFYDEEHVRRHGALPEPVQGTLFGHGAIHTLDGIDHRNRKLLFMSVLTDPHRVGRLAERAGQAWDSAAAGWVTQPRVILFDETARVLTRAVCDWAGVPLADADLHRTAADLTALVDGFATAGPRHWRARRARGRLERWLARVIEHARTGEPDDSVLDLVARHTGTDGRLLTPERAAVELLNVLRPTVAVSWFVTFAGHALHRWPRLRDRLRDGDLGYAVAFAHELRRFYPFAPFVGGLAVRDLTFQGEHIPRNALVLLDIFGQNHDPRLWPDPYRFDPQRFLDHEPGRDDLIPQGGGDPRAGHRCPGEDVTVALLATLAIRLARLDYEVPDQDLSISLRRIPALPRSRVELNVAGMVAPRDAVGGVNPRIAGRQPE